MHGEVWTGVKLKIERLKVAPKSKRWMLSCPGRRSTPATNLGSATPTLPRYDVHGVSILHYSATVGRNAYTLTAQIEPDLEKLGGDLATHNDNFISGACNFKDLAQRYYYNFQELDKVHQAEAQVFSFTPLHHINLWNVHCYAWEHQSHFVSRLTSGKSTPSVSTRTLAIQYWFIYTLKLGLDTLIKIKILVTLVVLGTLDIILIPIIVKYKWCVWLCDPHIL